MNNAELHILTEYSPYSMGFVIITKDDRAIIIDGGRFQELDNVASHVGNREVAAWILTHPDGDHIGAITDAMKHSHPLIAATKTFIYNFHSVEFCAKWGHAGDLIRFEKYNAPILNRVTKVKEGDEFDIDGLQFEILFSRDEKFTQNVTNDSSLVFRVTGEKSSVLFLGDLGPIAGDELLKKNGAALKTDVVQMAHHGHCCVGKEVYEAIAPRACIWCAQPWLYREPAEVEYGPRMYGTGLTRRWMRELGVREHYVTGDGDQVIII